MVSHCSNFNYDVMKGVIDDSDDDDDDGHDVHCVDDRDNDYINVDDDCDDNNEIIVVVVVDDDETMLITFPHAFSHVHPFILSLNTDLSSRLVKVRNK